MTMGGDVFTCGNTQYDQLGHSDWATSFHDQGADGAFPRYIDRDGDCHGRQVAYERGAGVWMNA